MNQTHTRRTFLKLAGFALGTTMLAGKAFALASSAFQKLTLSDDAWQKKLSAAQYRVLRHEGTEVPFTSDLLHEKRAGTFACVGCELPLFLSTTKFDSSTGWPSFFQCIDGHIETKSDTTLFMTRTEYHCARCGGHHGHLFNDGPKPTGLRYCSNGVALNFIPEKNV